VRVERAVLAVARAQLEQLQAAQARDEVERVVLAPTREAGRARAPDEVAQRATSPTASST
jgi:hypothetical protein